jgi:hypothetical protein
MSESELPPSIDVSENRLRSTGSLLDILLFDQTTKRNMIWATDSYIERGKSFSPKSTIQKRQITGGNGFVIQPRASKSKEEQNFRKREKAEVFTPLHIVDRMNKAADEVLGLSKTNKANWRDFVSARKIEIACGEGPYITGRYDPTASHQRVVRPKHRVGFLDRKLQVINKYCSGRQQWLDLAQDALKSTYGYEWQGDSLLIARENVLQTVVDFFEEKFGSAESLDVAYLEDCARIISWNIFQMDGIKFVIPMSCEIFERPATYQSSLFDETDRTNLLLERLRDCKGCSSELAGWHIGAYVKVFDWQADETFRFVDMVLR